MDFSVACMDAQTLQPDLWIVVDNSTAPEEDWSTLLTLSRPNVYYEHVEGDRAIGWMRNRCLDLALEKGADYILFWDDDDYYPPMRIERGVRALDTSDVDLAACSRMFILLIPENIMMTTGPFAESHGTAATYTIRASYARTHRFDEDKRRGEELEFTKQWTAKMKQLVPEETIVVMSHGRNTVDKSGLAKTPKLYAAEIVNDVNGKQVLRSRWPVRWDLFRRTFSV
jgi:glycosyltransferase involved in cell wall biosynthesis